VDDRFHRTPLVASCFKALQEVLPWAVGGAQCSLSNEVDSFGCAAQYDRRARADAQLRIDWKVRHSELTPSCGSSSIHPTTFIFRWARPAAIKNVIHLELLLEAEDCLIEKRRDAVKLLSVWA
jgi:hypothetical protein